MRIALHEHPAPLHARVGRTRARRRFLRTLCGAALAATVRAGAHGAAKVPRIGYLAASMAANAAMHRAFEGGLRQLGYVVGQNVLLEVRDAEGELDRLPALAADLARAGVDVIVAAGGTVAALAAKEATTTIPLVFIAVANPEASGLVATLGRPGGNATGLAALSPELMSKWLELLTHAVPGVDRIAVLWQPGALGARVESEMRDRAAAGARTLGVQVDHFEARVAADIDAAFADMARLRAGALAIPSTSLFITERRRIVQLAASNRLPTVYTFREYVDAGGLMAYGPNLADLFRRSAGYVDKILKGARPAELPVEQPAKFELILNLRAANALGMTFPPSLRMLADGVIH